MRRLPVLLVAAACLLLPGMAAAQGLTGALIGTVKDAQGGVLSGAVVRISSPALIGGPQTLTTNDNGELRFPALPPGLYVLDIEMQGFTAYREDGHPHRRRRHHRENACPERGRPRGIGRGRGSGLAHRRPGPRIRDSLRRRGSRRDPDETVQFVRLGQDGARDLAHLAGRRQRPRVRLRLGRGPESVSHRRHERHRSYQRHRASRSGHRLHSGAADPIRGRVGRVRQCPGRRRERHHQIWKQPFSI